MKHRKFPAPQISEAVFRGKKSFYNFEVYPLNIEFNDVPAVYVISRRKLDRHGRAHHAVFFLGQTESLAAEVKSHRRTKTVKEWQANAVSVLLAENESSRRAIEADLKAALPAVKAKPKAKQIEKPTDLRRAKMSDLKIPAEFENKKNIGKFPAVSNAPADKFSEERAVSKPKAKLKISVVAPAKTRSAARSEIQKPDLKSERKISVSGKKKLAPKAETLSIKQSVKKPKTSSSAKRPTSKSALKVLSARQKTIETIARKISKNSKAKAGEPKSVNSKTKISKSKIVSAKAKSPVVKRVSVSKSKVETLKVVQKPKAKKAIVQKTKAKKAIAKKSQTPVRQTQKIKRNLKTAKKSVQKTTAQRKISAPRAKSKQPQKRIVNLKKTVKNTSRKAA